MNFLYETSDGLPLSITSSITRIVLFLLADRLFDSSIIYWTSIYKLVRPPTLSILNT